MSQENVEIVRKAIEARNRDIDEFLRFFDPEVKGSDVQTVAGMALETQGTRSAASGGRTVVRRSSRTSESRSWGSSTSVSWSWQRFGSTAKAKGAERR